MDFGLSALFRLLRVCALSTGSFRRCQHAQRNKSQLQIRSDYLLSANNSHSIRVYLGFCSFQVLYLTQISFYSKSINLFWYSKQIFGLFQSEHKQNQHFRTRLFLVCSVSHELRSYSC